MRIIKIDSDKIIKEQVTLITDCFKFGDIVIYPTDTIPGIGCIATDKKAVKKIFKIKNRNPKKSLLVLVSDIGMVKKYCKVNKKQSEYLKEIWIKKNNRPTSIILSRKKNCKLPKELGEDSIAMRLPKNKFLIKIIKSVNIPIISTSVNLGGKESLISIPNEDEIEKIFPNNWKLIDLIIKDEAINKNKKPSRLIDLRNINDIKILRK